MKKGNLTREEAMEFMISGGAVRHDRTIVSPEGYYFYEDGAFYRKDCFSTKDLTVEMVGRFTSLEGFYVFEPKKEPEPKYKEVVMYAPVHHNPTGLTIGTSLYKDKEIASSPAVRSVGHSQVKVFLKE